MWRQAVAAGGSGAAAAAAAASARQPVVRQPSINQPNPALSTNKALTLIQQVLVGHQVGQQASQVAYFVRQLRRNVAGGREAPSRAIGWRNRGFRAAFGLAAAGVRYQRAGAAERGWSWPVGQAGQQRVSRGSARHPRHRGGGVQGRSAACRPAHAARPAHLLPRTTRPPPAGAAACRGAAARMGAKPPAPGAARSAVEVRPAKPAVQVGPAAQNQTAGCSTKLSSVNAIWQGRG